MSRIRCYACAVLLVASTSAGAGVYEDMLQAIDLEDERTVVNLLKRGVDVDTVSPDGDSLLILAAKSGKPAMMKALLAARPRLDARNRHGETALMHAAFRGHIDTVRQLLEHGAGVNHGGWTPLIYAAAGNRIEIARLLIGKGALINAPSDSGITALMMAAREGHLPMVLLLLERGAEIGQKNEDGMTALGLAQQRGQREVAEMLIRAGAKD